MDLLKLMDAQEKVEKKVISDPVLTTIRRFAKNYEYLDDLASGVLWVTDLCYCPVKRVIAEEYPELVINRQLLNPRLLKGSLCHFAVETLLKTDFPELEVEVERLVDFTISDEGDFVRVKGRIDILDRKNKRGWDLKFVRDYKDDLNNHYKLQGLFYLKIFDLEVVRFVCVPDGRIIRTWDVTKDTKVRTRIITVSIGNIDEYVKRWVEMKSKLFGPLWDWECSYCDFKSFCPVVSH